MAKEAAVPKLRIRIQSYDHKLVDTCAKQIIETAERNDAQIVGPVPLPVSLRKYTVNRAQNIDKNSREQFELRVHKRLIDIRNANHKIIEALSNLNLPAGVDVELKMI